MEVDDWHCQTCQGRNRKTTDMVCMSCGRDYMPDDGSDESPPGLGWKRLMLAWRELYKQAEAERDVLVLQEREKVERHRLAWLSACRDRSKIRHEMWAMQTRLKDLEFAEMLTGQSCQNGIHADWFVDSEYNHLCPFCECDRARAALARVEALRSFPVIVPAGAGSSRLQVIRMDDLRAAIPGDEPPATCPGCGGVISQRYREHGVCQNCYGTTDAIAGDPPAAVCKPTRSGTLVYPADLAGDEPPAAPTHEFLRAPWDSPRCFKSVRRADLDGKTGRCCLPAEHPIHTGHATPTHLPLSEVLELAADLAQRAATPPEAGHG